MTHRTVTFQYADNGIEMPLDGRVEHDESSRPSRVRFLVSLPMDLYTAICTDLEDIPDWDWSFIISDPSSWPARMLEVLMDRLVAKSE